MTWKYSQQWIALGTPRDVPKGYSRAEDVPVLRGSNHCRHCLCSPCIVTKPSNFLRGSCDPHPANSREEAYAVQEVLEVSEHPGILAG